jgi:hypothetical protein
MKRLKNLIFFFIGGNDETTGLINRTILSQVDGVLGSLNITQTRNSSAITWREMGKEFFQVFGHGKNTTLFLYKK